MLHCICINSICDTDNSYRDYASPTIAPPNSSYASYTIVGAA